MGLIALLRRKLKAAKGRPVVQPHPMIWGRTELAILAGVPWAKPWWSGGLAKPAGEAVASLVSVLIGHGGNGVIVPFEHEAICEAIAALGELVVPDGVSLRPGSPNSCHENCLGEWIGSHGALSMATGWALTEKWHAHSWLMSAGQVIETTSAREKYFGVTFDEADLLAVCRSMVAGAPV